MPTKEIPLNKMRHRDYAQDHYWIEDFLHEAQVGHIATVSEEGPYIPPTLFWYDSEKQEIYFHSNVTGHVRSNAEHYPQVCFEASRMGNLLPSNIALEFSVQYESVIAFGKVRILDDEAEKNRALYGLIEKYFPSMTPGEHYRPITDNELKRTSVYAISIQSWSGKRNWGDQADQGEEWPPLGQEWFE